MLHFSSILDRYYNLRQVMPLSIPNLHQKLINKCKQLYDEATQSTSSNLPYYEFGEIACLLKDHKAARYHFQNGSDHSDVRCQCRYAELKNDTDLLWKISQD